MSDSENNNADDNEFGNEEGNEFGNEEGNEFGNEEENEFENEEENEFDDYEENEIAFYNGSGSDEDEENEEDTKQSIQEMGAHKKMQRIQKVLYDQITAEDERVSLELREKEEGLRRLKTTREDVGVSLYGIQQQLAKLQMALESTHNKFNTTNDERFEAEESLDALKEEHDSRKQRLNDERRQLMENKQELDALNATLKQVKAYNEEMKSEIDVTKRATYKTEENISNLEKGKKKQDLYIDSLNEEIKSLKESIKINTFQISKQQEETQQAADTLKEAAVEMENIAFEKKQLLQQWKSSLIGMQRRDEALQATQQAMQQVRESEISIRSEIQGYKSSIASKQEENETLTATADRIDAEIRYCEEQLDLMNQEKERLSERYAMLQKSTKQTDVQTNAVTLETKNIDSEVAATLQSLDSVRRERHKLEKEINMEQNAQTTVHKSANNLTKEGAKVQAGIQECEITMANTQNEVAKVKVDQLNTTAHNAQLREKLKKLVVELKEKDTNVERKELEIRQRNDEIEKKMLRVDRLNKKYEQLTSNMEDANTGPLEATIKNIKKETWQLETESQQKQRAWLTAQTGLVNTSAEIDGVGEKNQELKSKISILEQKRLRLLNNIHHMQDEIKSLHIGVNSLHKDMVKLNDLIAKNSSLQEKISNHNFGMEQEFVEELKELEADSIKSETHFQSLKAEKQQLLDEIVEIERQAMLWEKKIQLEKETQAALDPEVGQQEARNMEKEIHRMKIRYETLLRDQERMVVEIERGLHKRDAIALRGRGQKSNESTQASTTKKISSLENDLRKSQRELGKYKIAIREKSDQVESLSYDLENCTLKCSQQEQYISDTQKSINDALYDKQRYIDIVGRKQRLAKRYDKLISGKAPEIDPSDAEKVSSDNYSAIKQLKSVQSILRQLQNDHPHLQEVLQRVAILTNDA